MKGTFFFGEVYDARQENPLTSGSAITATAWQPVQESAEALKVRPRIYQPERVTEEVTPVEVFSPAPGVWTFDLGEMISGGVEWQVPDDLPAGAEVVFRYGQELRRQGCHMAGLEWYYPPENQTADKSRLLAHYTDLGVIINMAGLSPQQTLSHIPCDLYVSGGRQGAMWRSSERNHAFRYVEVVGLMSQPRADSLKGLMIHNDSPPVGTFQSSEPAFNRFHDLCVKTELMNEHGIFSDCWDREKWAWGGNWTKERFVLYAHDNSGLNRKATADYADALRKNGKLGFDTFNIGNPWALTTVVWPASFLYLPWEAYKFTGDIRPLRDNFDSLLQHLRDVYERQQAAGQSLVITNDTSITDWLWFGQWAAGAWLAGHPELKDLWTDGKPFGFFAPRSQSYVVSTAVQCDQAGIAARIAGMLGRTEDENWLNDLHDQTKAALHSEFYNPTAFSYGKNPDSGPWGADVEDSIMLDTGIAPPELRDTVYGQMLEGLRQRGHQPISGIITMQNFTSVLADHGAADDAYEVYSYEGNGGIKNVMQSFPDALPEAFYHISPISRVGSRCHADMAGWAHWFYYGLGGLRPDVSAPGFKHFVLAPQIPRKMKSAEITHESPYGKIVSSWKQEGDTVLWKVVVPPNSSATALIPAAGASAIREGGKPLEASGLAAGSGASGTVSVELPAGTYAFEFYPLLPYLAEITTYVNPVGGTFYPTPGPKWNAGAGPGYVYGLPGTYSYTNTSATGCYWVEISWGVHSSHNTSIAYSVNGTIYQTVNETLDVTGTATNAVWSGFKALNKGATGIIILTNGVSQIVSATNSANTGTHTTGLWRTTRLTGTLINPTAFGTPIATSSSPGNGNYYYVNTASNSFAIGSALAPGVYKLEISWGVHAAHSSAVTYSYNQTGAGGFAGATTVVAGVNQQAMNDGRAYTKPTPLTAVTWSGFKTLGTFTVGAGSQIWLSGGTTTMGVIQATRINHAPVATNITMGAVSGVPARLKIIGGKYAPTDPENDNLTVSAVTYTGGFGGGVTTDGTNATYTSANTFTGTDYFNYTVSDGNGRFATNTVTVTVLSNGPSYNLLSPPLPVGSGTVVLTYVGIPDYPYDLDWAANLTQPIAWLPVVTNTADTNGLVNFTNTSAAPVNFFRTRQP